jgi:hypothetical protein
MLNDALAGFYAHSAPPQDFGFSKSDEKNIELN